MTFDSMQSVLAVCAVVASSLSVGGCEKESAEDETPAEQKAKHRSETDERPKQPEPTAMDPPARAGAMAPEVFETDDGFGLSWLEPVREGSDAEEGASSHELRFSRWNGDEWSEGRNVVEREEMFSNWADVPAVVETGEDSYLAHWLQKSGDATYAYDLVMARSTDGGSNWETLGSPYEDESETEHGFASHVALDGSVLTFWLDGRARSDGTGPMALRATELDPSAGSDGDWFAESTVVDDRVCECCPTDAVRVGDSVVAVYRGRSEEEVRDIWTVRRVEGEWAEPRKLSDEEWTIEGCPVNGPAAAVDESTVAAAWFTEADGRPRVKLAFSDDGGKDYSEPVVIASRSEGRAPLGRVDVAFVDGEAVVSWLAETPGEEGGGVVAFRRVSTDGELAEPATVADTSPERKSGIPRIVAAGDGAVVVWRGAEDSGQLRARRYPAGALSGTDAGGDSEGTFGTAVEERPALQARSLAGVTVDLDDLEGPTLVNLWATWCAPCKAEMPLLEKVQNEWSDRGLHMVGLSVEGERARDKIATFAENNEVPFEIWFAPQQEPLSTFGASAVPATFVYDSGGELVWAHDGKIEEGQLEQLQKRVASLVEP